MFGEVDMVGGGFIGGEGRGRHSEGKASYVIRDDDCAAGMKVHEFLGTTSPYFLNTSTSSRIFTTHVSGWKSEKLMVNLERL